MAWFLSSRSSAPKRKTRKRKKKGHQAWDPARTLAGLKWIGAVAAVVVLCVAWRWSETALQRYADERRAEAVDVALIDAPAWLSDHTRRSVQRLVAERAGGGVFDREALVAAAQKLSAQPEVASVDQVRRVPGGIRVSARYREPAALVEFTDGYHVIDAEGVWLAGPRGWHDLERTDLPVLTQVRSPRPAVLGGVWKGADVDAGLGFAALVRGRSWVGQIESVDVGQTDPRNGKPVLVLHTDAGRVVWGRPVSEAWSASEVSTEQKLERLDLLAEQYLGRIDAGGRTVLLAGEQLQFDERDIYAEFGGEFGAEFGGEGTPGARRLGRPGRLVEPTRVDGNYTAGR